MSINIFDTDTEFRQIARDSGFTETSEFEDATIFEIPDKFPPILLPRGFSLVKPVF